MSDLKLDSLVKIVFSCWNKDGIEGQYGRIVAVNFNTLYDFSVQVTFPGAPSEVLGFNADELELIEEGQR